MRRHILTISFHGECENMRDYLLQYNRLDVILLADVLSIYKDRMKAEFGLYLDHSPTLPSFSFQCLLYHLKIVEKIDHIETPTEHSQLELINKGKMGGISGL